jgi:DNA repair exonuclease SbcCD ATPase subunit
VECRRHQAAKDKSVFSMQNRIETLKSNIKTLRGQLEEARLARKQSDQRCGQLESVLVEKQMEIDQLKADAQILHSAAARLRSGSTLLSRQPVVVVADGADDDADGPQSFDPPTQTSHPPADDDSAKIARAMTFLDGTLLHIERCFGAIASTTKAIMSRQDLFPPSSQSRLHALDLATVCLFDRGQVPSPTLANAFQNLSDILLRAQSHVARQKHSLQSFHSRDDEHIPLSIVQNYEEQLDTLLADLQAANQALSDKDNVLEKMHDISSRHEAERRQLDRSVAELKERLQVQQQLQEQPLTSVKANEARCVETCQRAGVHMLLQVIDKRNVTAMAVAYRQWACHTSARTAVARQRHIAAVLSDQLQETQGKLKLLKRHLKKSRGGGSSSSCRGGGHNHAPLNTIAETSRDDDDEADKSPSKAGDYMEWR